jgi:hypothetical protein
MEKSILTRIIRAIIKEEIAPEDGYSLSKGMKPYFDRKKEFFDSIKSFKDIDEQKIDQILYFLGYDGFDSEQDAKEYLVEAVDEYKNLPDPVTLYRVVFVKNKKAIKIKQPGEHYVLYKWMIDSHLIDSIGGYELTEEDDEPYILNVQAPLSSIDVLQTIIQNLSFPNEREINIKDKGRTLKVVKVEKYN